AWVSSRRSITGLPALALTAALGAAAAGLGCSGHGELGPDAAPDPARLDASPDPDASPEPFEAQFVWPTPAWIAANDRYPDGLDHSGSADLAVPYMTPVGAARAGVVHSAGFTTIGGYLVR